MSGQERKAIADKAFDIDGLVRVAAATEIAQAPDTVRERLRDLVVDTLAVTAWGSRRAELASLRAVAAEGTAAGAATVFGTSVPRPAMLACALNGAAAAADQLQDGHRLARGHPASHVVHAVYPLAEELDASTEALLSAVLAGYEVGARLGVAMGGTPTGVHDIGTWGTVAAAVGTAHLLRPGDPPALRRAIELAGSALLLTDAATIFTGHTGGHAYLGSSVAQGLWLGQAAAAGLAAAPGSLERFFAPHASAHWQGLPPVEGPAWPEYEVLRGYVKLHPACAHLHGVLDALDDAMLRLAERGAHGSEVARVDVRTYAAAAAFAAPAGNELQARFSIPTSVALALLHGPLDESAVITDAQVRARAVQALAARVEVAVDEELDAGYPEGRPSSVEVTLQDGTTARGASIRPRGDADGHAARDALHRKAERLIRGSFGVAARHLLDVLAGWPDRHTPRELGSTFRAAAVDRDRERS